MTTTEQCILAATLALAMAYSTRKAMGQTAPYPPRQQFIQMQPTSAPSPFLGPKNLPLENLDPPLFLVMPEISYTFPPLLSFVDSNIKFKLETLMDTLRDSRHESWVLAAYPDPKTSRPLIGAGFSLDVKATEHLQCDPLNPHTFIEPSSVQLWQLAGLNPGKLEIILDQFDSDLKAWNTKNFRRKIRTQQLLPELTDEEATKLLQISVVLAVHNARAYCREFDQLTSSQQMALSQLVFQMGVNLEEFTRFLSAINDLSYRDSAQLGSDPGSEAEHWKAVQRTLIHSDWARRYTSRAVAVIAMFDPNYDDDPTKAESQVRAEIWPLPVVHHRNKQHARSVRTENDKSRAHKIG
jgi:Phage lysozyme